MIKCDKIPDALVTALATFMIAITAGAQSTPADLILTGGKIITLDESQPRVEAVALQGDRIRALGGHQRIMEQWAGPNTRIIDLKGRLTIPGFIEGHGHFLGLGDSLMILDLSSAANWQAVVRQVAAACAQAKPDTWIRGRGWHQDKWDKRPQPAVEGLPVHHRLSEMTPNHPVILTHASGHASFVNAKAMALAGIDRNTSDPPGGEILRDAVGEPTGFLRETAQSLVRAAAARANANEGEPDRRIRQAELAARECLRHGVTTFHDAGSSFADVAFFKSLADEGRLPLRLWVMIRGSDSELAHRLDNVRLVGYANHRLTVRAIKVWLDGALGARGAWLLEPYADAPNSVGLNLMSLEDLHKIAALAAQKDFQLCVHAIGDRANRETLNCFEQTFEKYPSQEPRRWRIEHVQHLHPDDIHRFAQLSIIASMQAVHCISDGPWVPDRLGLERSRSGAYVWRDLMQTGALIVNGSDTPVERIDPIACFHASVTRRLPDGSQFFPEQCMTRMEALKSYTINAARAAFEDTIKGSLEPGRLADIVVLSKDILTCPEEEITKAKVELTIIGGQIAYRHQE